MPGVPESEYNNGKGVQFSLTFTPLPPPSKAVIKHQANSKKKTTNIIFYTHKTSEMYGMLCETMASVKQQDIPFTITPAGKLVADMIKVTYSILCDAKKFVLGLNDDYTEMTSQAKKKPGFLAEVKLSIDELKVC